MAERKKGISAMLRVKDEEEWLPLALDSVMNWCDEVVLCLQPCNDKTPEIAVTYMRSFPEKVTVHLYPYESWPNGPGYDSQDAADPHSRTFFYNWCLARTTRRHVVKWDGDMVAMDWLGGKIRRAVLDYKVDLVRFHGVDLTAYHPPRVGSVPCTSSEIRVFRVLPGTRYVNGLYSEKLEGTTMGSCLMLHDPAFAHTKWLKRSARQAWPENWQDIPHFQRINERGKSVREYTGPLPSVLAWMWRQ